MKIYSLIGFLFFCSMLLSSCDDDLKSVGGNIQPGGDNASLEVDSLDVKARTILMNDSVYIRNTTGLLGRYEDGTYGSILSEYLTEFDCTDKFKAGVDRIDSTRIFVDFYTYSGDSIAPMGVSFYQLNNNLDKNYYSNVDISKYCDLSKLLGSTSYTIKNTPYESLSSKVRTIKVDMGDWGQKLYDASKTSNNPLENSKAFLNYFPGVYVKSSFGNGSLINVLGTSIAVYYTTKKDTIVTVPDAIDKTITHKKDSVMYANKSLVFIATSGMTQLNKLQSKVPASLLAPNTGAIYIKSPAGVCAELELPIKDIIEGLETNQSNKSKTVSMARLKFRGYTEIEQKNPFELGRVSTLMLINKDSVHSFFENPYRVADLSSRLIYVTSRNASSNTYEFSNLAPMISEYRKLYKENKLTANPKFWLVPVSMETTSSNNSVLGYFNSMKPAVSVIRAGEGDIKLEMIYSSF